MQHFFLSIMDDTTVTPHSRLAELIRIFFLMPSDNYCQLPLRKHSPYCIWPAKTICLSLQVIHLFGPVKAVVSGAPLFHSSQAQISNSECTLLLGLFRSLHDLMLLLLWAIKWHFKACCWHHAIFAFISQRNARQLYSLA